MLGVQLQESQLPAKLRVAEALDLYSSFYREPADRRSLLGALGLADKSMTPFRKLSGGQKQRLSIALALVGAPRIAVLDELTTGLDPQARRDTWELIEGIRDDDSYVLPAIEAGATGYLLKDAPRAELLRAVRAAARGEAVLAPSVAARLMSKVRTAGAQPGGTSGSGTSGPQADSLSKREREVLELVAAGATNREAAALLLVSEATVKTHLLHIYAKLGVSDRTAAVTEAFTHGILKPGSR